MYVGQCKAKTRKERMIICVKQHFYLFLKINTWIETPLTTIMMCMRVSNLFSIMLPLVLTNLKLIRLSFQID